MKRGERKQLEAGDAAPDLRLARLGGGEARLISEVPVLLAFFKVSCPVCQLTLPFVERLHPGARVYAISQNGAEATREFSEHYGLTMPTLLDGEEDGFPASNAFGITHVPTMFLIEPGGRIGRVIEGWNRREMERLGALRAGDNVPEWKSG